MDYEQQLRRLLEATEIYHSGDEVFALVSEDPATKEYTAFCGYNTNEDNPVAGFDLQLASPHHCHILHMYVRPEQRRQGIASRLVRCIERFALDNGVRKLIVTPVGDGHQFWPKVGFLPRPESSVSLFKMLEEHPHAR